MKQSVRIQETGKTVEIKDGNDNLKFRITFEKGVDGQLQDVYQIKVFNSNEETPLSIESYELESDAEHAFCLTVRNYKFLVQSESKPIDDIQLFAERIDYRNIDVDCCLNCEFSYKNLEKYVPGKIRGTYDLFCSNPDNFVIFNNTVQMGKNCFCKNYPECPFGKSDDTTEWIYKDMINPKDRCHCNGDFNKCVYDNCQNHGHMIPRPKQNPPKNMLLVHPRVDFNGICKNYKKKIKHCQEPHPKQPTC